MLQDFCSPGGRWIRLNAWFLSLALPALAASALHAESTDPSTDPSTGAAEKADNGSDNSTDKQQAPAALAGDSFPVADGTVEELFKQLEAIVRKPPTEETELGMIAHQKKVARTIVVIADKVLSLKPGEQPTVQAYFLKLQALDGLSYLGEPKAESLLAKTIADARKSDNQNVAALGIKFFIDTNFSKWSALGEKERRAVVDAIAAYMSQVELHPAHVQMLVEVADFLDNMGDAPLGSDLLEGVLPRLRTSEQPTIQRAVALVEGLHRRLNLLGEKMEIKGTLMDGSPIDWKAYQGKIVLVDFWASWCRPCRQELPNVLKHYRAYHDKGFDVVGICLDDNREAAEAYINEKQLPWAIIFGEKDDERGWVQPLAEYYGVTGVPRAILVDRDGKVVSMNARGTELARQLRKRLGEPLAQSGSGQGRLIHQVQKVISAD